jgi:twitching motility protein PilT
LPRIGGGRIVATEVIIANNLIRRLILEEKSSEIPVNMEGSQLEGMNTMEQTLADLVNKKFITGEDALLRSSNPVRLKKFLEI